MNEKVKESGRVKNALSHELWAVSSKPTAQSPKRRALLTAMIFLTTLPLADAVWIGGFYEVETVSRKINNENNRWDFQTPRHHLQFKFYADPFKGVDLYSQFNVDSNDFRSQQKKFFLDRAWAKFAKSKWEAIALKREERHFLDFPLLRLVDQDFASYNRDSEGIRFNFWNFYRLRGSLILSVDDETKKSFSPQVGEWFGSFFDQKAQSFVAKTNWRIFEEKKNRSFLDVGVAYLRKDWQYEKFSVFSDTSGNRSFLEPATSLRPKNEVVSLEARVGFGGASWNSEVAISSSNGVGNVGSDGEAWAWSSEVRDFRIGNFLLRGTYFDYRKNFRSELSRKFSGRRVRSGGSNEFDRQGYSSEMVYFEPRKLVQFTFRRTEYRTSVDSTENNPALREDYLVRHSTDYFYILDQFGEMFVQFVGGMQGRIQGSHFKGRSGDFYSSTLEIRGENPIGFARMQFRIRDIGSQTGLGERFIVGGEFRVNLTKNLQLLTRLVNVQSNFTKMNWWSGFGQLRYFMGTDAEILFEYGDGGPTGNLAEGGIADDTTLRPVDQVKLIFKINF